MKVTLTQLLGEIHLEYHCLEENFPKERTHRFLSPHTSLNVVLSVGEQTFSLLTEIRGFRLTQIPIEVRPVRFLQARTQSEIRQFQMAPGVQQQIIRFNITMYKT